MIQVKYIKNICNSIGLVSQWSGRIWSFLVVFMILIITFDVTMRYIFNKPTQWAYDVSYMLLATFISMGFCFVMRHRNHVRVDVLYSHLSPRGKLIVDLLFTLIIFFPLFFKLTMVTFSDVLYALEVNEKTAVTYWYTPTAPYKLMVAIGLALFFLQGVATFLEDLASLIKGGKKPW